MTKTEQNKRRKELYAESVEYYRKHPDEFCTDVLEIKIILYQAVMIRAFFKYPNVCFVMGRGIGKSFTSMLCLVIYALLYPGSKIGIISGSFRQAKKVIEEKYKGELCERSPFLRQEESGYVCSVQAAKVTFFNKSFIEAYPIGNDGAKIRGARLHVCLIDEAAYVPKKIIDEVILPMTLVEQGFEVGQKTNQEDVTNNKIILASSASYRTNWLYEVYSDWTKNMLSKGNREFFTMTLPYTVGVQAGFMKQSKVDERKLAMSEMAFATEYLGVFPKIMDGVWINPEDYTNCKNLTHIETQGNINSEYVISIDVARMDGQDNTIIDVFKLHQFDNRIETDFVYTQSLNGCSFAEQAKAVRDMLDKFPTTIRIYVDTMTIGMGLTDELAKDYYDEMHERWLPPLIDMNDEVAMRNKENTHGNPIIYGIKGNPEINHKCGYAVKLYTEKRWLHLYSEDAGDMEHIKSGKDFTKEELNILEENKETEVEVLSMDAAPLSSGYMKFTPRGKRKDRWSALGYGLYGIQLIKKERDDRNKRGEVLIAFHKR